MAGYLQYLLAVDWLGNGIVDDSDAMMGARPFAAGLQIWLKRSPLFNVDKVSAALQVTTLGRANLTLMWEPYALMRRLNKPVDLIVLNNKRTCPDQSARAPDVTRGLRRLDALLAAGV